jgi:hypothetical protein
VRSLASETAKQHNAARLGRVLDWYASDFEEELSAFDGRYSLLCAAGTSALCGVCVTLTHAPVTQARCCSGKQSLLWTCCCICIACMRVMARPRRCFWWGTPWAAWWRELRLSTLAVLLVRPDMHVWRA